MFKEIVLAMVEKAKSGDTAAQKILMEYILGKPKQTTEISTTEGSAALIRDTLAAMDSKPDDNS